MGLAPRESLLELKKLCNRLGNLCSCRRLKLTGSVYCDMPVNRCNDRPQLDNGISRSKYNSSTYIIKHANLQCDRDIFAASR